MAAKEARSQRQQEMLKKYNLPLVSITINMPGPNKDLPVLRRLCDYAVAELKADFKTHEILQLYLLTGPEALLVIDRPVQELKAKAVAIEEAQPFGRLLDIDVFTNDGNLVSRRQQGRSRACLVCGQDTIICMRENRHQLADLMSAVNKLLVRFKAYLTHNLSPEAQRIGQLAVEAMLFEVACTPAPGLVDRNNSGAHNDMDFFTFMASTAALSSAMARTAQAGINHEGNLADMLPVLRAIGIEAEQAMLAATSGVNTQKGLLFSLGIAAAAAGHLQRRGRQLKAECILDIIAEITAGIVERELGSSAQLPDHELTAGERLYRQHKITGIRGEMENGLPAVREVAIPALKQSLAAGLSANDALIDTLLALMMKVDDTTVMHRHNPDKMRYWVRDKAAAALMEGGIASEGGRASIERLDKEFIAHNVSPGGAADLLAVAWFLHRLETES